MVTIFEKMKQYINEILYISDEGIKSAGIMRVKRNYGRKMADGLRRANTITNAYSREIRRKDVRRESVLAMMRELTR